MSTRAERKLILNFHPNTSADDKSLDLPSLIMDKYNFDRAGIDTINSTGSYASELPKASSLGFRNISLARDAHY